MRPLLLLCLVLCIAVPPAVAHVSPASGEGCGSAAFPTETTTLHAHRNGPNFCTNVGGALP